jgi:hypothetical protein
MKGCLEQSARNDAGPWPGVRFGPRGSDLAELLRREHTEADEEDQEQESLHGAGG